MIKDSAISKDVLNNIENVYDTLLITNNKWEISMTRIVLIF